MSSLMIEFDPSLGFWSVFTYWFVVVNAILCAGFIVVVTIGGFFDLRFLFRALNEQTEDVHDDGRVETPPAQLEPHADKEPV